MANFTDVAVDKIELSEGNVRETIHEESIRELAESIREQGLLQPIVVVPTPDGERYEVVVGQRRLEAVKLVGWTTIPAQVVPRRKADELMVLSLVENVQREDLPDSERAKAVVALVGHFGSYETVAKRLGYSEASIRRWTALHGVWPELKEMVDEGKLADTEATRLTRALPREQAVAVAEELVDLPRDVRDRALRDRHLGVDPVDKVIDGAKKPPERRLTVRFHEVVLGALEKAAETEKTTADSLAVTILQDWLEEHGYLPS